MSNDSYIGSESEIICEISRIFAASMSAWSYHLSNIPSGRDCRKFSMLPLRLMGLTPPELASWVSSSLGQGSCIIYIACGAHHTANSIETDSVTVYDVP